MNDYEVENSVTEVSTKWETRFSEKAREHVSMEEYDFINLLIESRIIDAPQSSVQ